LEWSIVVAAATWAGASITVSPGIGQLPCAVTP
jgi:hypothetical protein